MQKITPFLWFNEQTEEAVAFYTSIFQNGKIDSISRFGDDVPGPKGKVITATFHLAGQEFMALNGGPDFTFTPAISFWVDCQSESELDKLWANLAEGGSVLMELGPYPFSQKFGWLNDRFGVSWQLSLSGTPQKINPYLLFVGEQNGRAEEAAQFYTSVFENSSIVHLERFGNEAGGPVEAQKLVKFILAGQEFTAFDGGPGHNFTFTEATSFMVDCKDQAEVDYFWEKLTEGGGEPGPCGWLKDKFGVSWQVVPAILGVLMNDPDTEKAGRVTQAMLQMGKIEIAQLLDAYEKVA